MLSSRLFSISCLFAAISCAQTAVPALPANEVSFFTGLFHKIGDIHFDPALAQREEAAAAKLFGLDASESAALHSAALNFRSTMKQLRESEIAIISGKNVLADTDRGQIAQLVQKRDQAVSALAVTLLGSVRAETAGQLRRRAQDVGNLLMKKGEK